MLHLYQFWAKDTSFYGTCTPDVHCPHLLSNKITFEHGHFGAIPFNKIMYPHIP